MNMLESHAVAAYDWLRKQTLCRLGRHSKQTDVKWDGGRMSHLCRHCRLILWSER